MVVDVDIQSKWVKISNTAADLGLGAVPGGMKRFITFVKYNNEYNGANAVFLCSGSTATDAASGVAKDKQFLANQYDTIAYPDTPDPGKPLFTIVANKYLTGFTSAGAMGVFVQYYDE